MKKMVMLMAFAMLAMQPAAFAANDAADESGPQAATAEYTNSVDAGMANSDVNSYFVAPGGGHGGPGGGGHGGGPGGGHGGPGGPGGGGHGPGGGGPGHGPGGGGHGPGPGFPGGGGGHGGGWPGGGHGGGWPGPGFPGGRGVICYAQDFRGQNYSAVGAFAPEAQNRAIYDCERYSGARCRPAGCNSY